MTAATHAPIPNLPPIGDSNLFDSPAPTPMDVAGPTLDDTTLGTPVAAGTPAVEQAAPAMTNEQIIGLVAQLSSFGLPPELAAAYAEDFQANSLVQLGVQFSGLADALAEYGLTSGSGKLPPWMAVLLGVTALGYGVYTTRGKYAPAPDTTAAAQGAADSFGIAGGGTPLQAADIGYAGESAGGSHA